MYRIWSNPEHCTKRKPHDCDRNINVMPLWRHAPPPVMQKTWCMCQATGGGRCFRGVILNARLTTPHPPATPPPLSLTTPAGFRTTAFPTQITQGDDKLTVSHLLSAVHTVSLTYSLHVLFIFKWASTFLLWGVFITPPFPPPMPPSFLLWQAARKQRYVKSGD